MFEKFGEFDSWEDINKAAAGFKEEGDADSLLALAKENGISADAVTDYVAGDTDSLCTVTDAAIGRLEIEAKDSSEDEGQMRVIRNMASAMIVEDERFATAVTKKGKRLEEVLKRMREEARKSQKNGVGCVCGTDRDLQKRIRDYYEGSAA